MKLYLQRHAYAGEFFGQVDSPQDRARSLTPEGEDTAHKIGQWMKDNGEAPTRVLCSPVKRCVETARIMGGYFGLKPEQDPNMDIRRPMQMVVRKLGEEGDKRVLLVGHHDNIEPGLANLNMVDKEEVDPIAKGEMRILKVKRKSGAWKEEKRVRPSEVGEVDYW